MSKRWIWALVGIILIVGIVYRWHDQLQLYAHTVSACALYPVLIVHKQVIAPLKSLFAQRKTLAQLHHVLAATQRDRDRLLAENIELRSQVAYAKEVQELSNFKKRYQYEQAVVAQVLVRSFSEHAHYFLIDAGSNRGVKPDTPVVYNNTLIGKVTDVYSWYSKVTSITDASCKVAVKTAKHDAHGIYEGLNTVSGASLRYVPHLQTVEDGEMIISSGQGLIFPKGFALGKVTSHSLDGLYYKIAIEPLCDFDAIGHCLVLNQP